MEDKYQPIAEICRELGLDPEMEYQRLKDSIFSDFIEGDSLQTAQMDMEVVRMWIASMIDRKKIKPEMYQLYDQIKQLGIFSLKEAWQVSKLSPDAFKEMVLYGRSSTKFNENGRILH